MEKLHIQNFAGLKHVEIDVKKITGFIGSEASGKSIIAKLLYFFREISRNLPSAIGEGMGDKEYRAACVTKFNRYFSVSITHGSNFKIRYSSRNEFICVSTSEKSLSLEWSPFFRTAIKELTSKKQPLWGRLGKVDEKGIHALLSLHDEYENEAIKYLGPWSTYDQILIPALRAFFSQPRVSAFALYESGDPDPFLLAFASILDRCKSYLEKVGFFDTSSAQFLPDENINQILKTKFKSILNAQVALNNKQEFLQYDDGRLVDLAHASSGQQEVLPLLVLFAYFFSVGNQRGRAVYVEEPEAHLFPSTQKRVVELMARVFRKRNPKMHLVLTTHSPYILASINNLLEAGKLYEGGSGATIKRLRKVIPQSESLMADDVAFYALEDGKAKSIMDPETNLIEAEMIDKVSDDIAVQFDELLWEGNEKH